MIELVDILVQQQKANYVWEDILFEVVAMAQRENIPVVGSTFEADHQLISLMNQNIIDFVLTNDSDLPFQGCARTIMNLSKRNAKCHLITRDKVLNGLKKMFDSTRELDKTDSKFIGCMLDNDYVDRVKGEGVGACTKKMKALVKVKLSTRKQWMDNNNVERMESIEHRRRFNHSFEFWEHAPAFWIVCNDSNRTPRQMFHSDDKEYDIDLRSMTGTLESNDARFLITKNNDDGNRTNMRIGFIPHTTLSANHPSPATSLEMFSMSKWSRTAKPLVGINAIYNENDEQLCHGSVIDFDKRPPHLLSDDVLLFWLATRGVNNRIDGRTALL